jgi:integrase/recombinase XerD
MLEVRPLKTGEFLPRDLTVSQVKTLLQVVSTPMDRAWIILMLHSGLRTCEVRSLCWCDVDLQAKSIRIHESKGLRSRKVFLSPQIIQAFNCLPRISEYIFTYRNQPLSPRYCQSRLTTMGMQCGFHVTPHQLRHTCATMLLNAGMSILSVQRILGHKYVETTLRYARVYDSTVVKDFQMARSKR